MSNVIRVVDFKTEYRSGRDPVDMVLIAPGGAAYEKCQTWHRVAKLRPPETHDTNVTDSASYKDMEAKWTIIGPAYSAWRKGEALPETGTPLAAWSGVTADQAAFLRKMAIRTVEEVRDMGERAVAELAWPDARKLPALAKAFLEGEHAAAKDAKIAELEERMAVMAEMLEERGDVTEPKAKRGRPRKEEAA